MNNSIYGCSNDRIMNNIMSNAHLYRVSFENGSYLYYSIIRIILSTDKRRITLSVVPGTALIG